MFPEPTVHYKSAGVQSSRKKRKFPREVAFQTNIIPRASVDGNVKGIVPANWCERSDITETVWKDVCHKGLGASRKPS